LAAAKTNICPQVPGGNLQLSAIILARALGYIELFDLSPRGKTFFPDIVPEIVKRYNFQKFPKTPEELDESKGVEFLEGKAGNKVIQKFAVWSTLLVVETRSNTAESKQILEDILAWGAEKFGLNYKPGMIKRFAYVSTLTFHSDAPILGASPALNKLAATTSEAVSEIWQEPIRYDPTVVTIGHDPLTRKYGIASLTIQRRAEARFSENKYFSEAPLPTDLHLKLLEQYEKDVLSLAKSSAS
jgi:hypothetical protein